MAEKFSEYADLKQLLLEKVVGGLQREVEARGTTLRQAKFGGTVYYNRRLHEKGGDGFQEAVAGRLAELDQAIQAEVDKVNAFFEADEPGGEVKEACEAYDQAIALLSR